MRCSIGADAQLGAVREDPSRSLSRGGRATRSDESRSLAALGMTEKGEGLGMTKKGEGLGMAGELETGDRKENGQIMISRTRREKREDR